MELTITCFIWDYPFGSSQFDDVEVQAIDIY